MIYEFTLILEDDLTDEMANRLYEAGCDDATIGRQGGRTMAMFDREGRSYESAVSTAVRDVNKAGYKVLSVERDA